MQFSPLPRDRRHFLRLTLGLSAGALLSGCGGAGDATGDPVVAAAAPAAPAPAATPVQTAGSALNLVLNLAYIGAQYYGQAARGAELPADLTGGTGRAGVTSGARQASFTDPLIAGYAAELADDKQAHVVALRNRIGALAAAQPAIDLSTMPTGAFSVAARGAGIVAAGSAFDPYSSDRNFLLGAFLIENAVAAAYRPLLAPGGEDATLTVVSETLAEAIYHGGLIRSLLEDQAVADSSVETALSDAGLFLATFDGSNVGDQTLAGASGGSSNIVDADGRAIPFTRSSGQILKSLYLSTSRVGGFLPMGANGVA